MYVNLLPSLLTLRPYTTMQPSQEPETMYHTKQREGSRIFLSEEGTGLEVHEGDRSLLEFYTRCPLEGEWA